MCGDDRADTRLGQEVGRERSDVSEDFAFEDVGFVGCCLDSLRERAKCEDRCQLVGCARARAAEAAASSK